MTRDRGLTALSAIWLVIVTAYTIYCGVNESGLYGWLADHEMTWFGFYSLKLTFLLPWLLFAAPALWWLRRQTEIARAAASTEPGAQARAMSRIARWLALAGIAAALISVTAFLLSQRVPDGSEAPAPFDAAALGAAPLPTGRVAIRGDVDPDAATTIEEGPIGSPRRTMYAGFHLEGETGKSGPIRLFVERNAGGAGDSAVTQAFLPDQDGYLVENWLPQLAIDDLARRGVRVASPHYLLRPAHDARRIPYYVTAALAGVFAFILLVTALLTVVQARQRARLAQG
jgi:hypothetical protein